MKNYFIGIYLCSLVFCASAQVQTATDPELDRLIGKVFLILAEQYAVCGQSGNGSPSLWINAKLESVPYPASKSNDPEIKWKKEMVPTESGIVLKFNPPFNPDTIQSGWLAFRDDEAKKFGFYIVLPDKRVIRVIGTYGSTFPKKYVDRLIELSKSGE